MDSPVAGLEIGRNWTIRSFSLEVLSGSSGVWVMSLLDGRVMSSRFLRRVGGGGGALLVPSDGCRDGGGQRSGGGPERGLVFAGVEHERRVEFIRHLDQFSDRWV